MPRKYCGCAATIAAVKQYSVEFILLSCGSLHRRGLWLDHDPRNGAIAGGVKSLWQDRLEGPMLLIMVLGLLALAAMLVVGVWRWHRRVGKERLGST